MKEDKDIRKLAKFGKSDELLALWAGGQHFDLGTVFERAVTDFRTVRRNPDHLELLKFCLDEGLEISRERVSLAAQFGNDEIVEHMIALGVPDDPFIAACLGDIGGLRREDLHELYDDDGFNLLHYCAGSQLDRKRDLAATCECLAKAGVDPAHVVEGELPISPAFRCAAFGGNSQIMGALLASGKIDVAAMHLELEFTLEPHQRSGEPFYEVARVILDHGFDLNSIRPEQGRTLLHGSANRGSNVAVEWLLANGADPNALDLDGKTPLHVAAERNTHTRVIEGLLAAGADRGAATKDRQTALQIAEEKGRAAVVEFLR